MLRALTKKSLGEIFDSVGNVVARGWGSDSVEEAKVIVMKTTKLRLNCICGRARARHKKKCIEVGVSGWCGYVIIFTRDFSQQIFHLQAAARVPMLTSWTLKEPVIKDWMEELLSFLGKMVTPLRLPFGWK